MDSGFADRVTELCLKHYQRLSKKGKPISTKEWTLLSAIVLELDCQLIVVALATGTKCLGRSEMSPRGDVINDSHAEVLTRRCFLRYMYDQMFQFKDSGASEIIVSRNENNQFEINPKAKFHFYTSHVPCGDASIIPKIEDKQVKRKSETLNDEAVKRTKIDCTNEHIVYDEDLRNDWKRSTVEECSISVKKCMSSCSDEDLRSGQEAKLVDEDLRFSSDDRKKCKKTQITLPLVDEDLRTLSFRIEEKNTSCFDEDLRSINRSVQKPMVEKFEDQDDRTINKTTNASIEKLQDEDFRTVKPKLSPCKADEDFRCSAVHLDEDLRIDCCKQPCVEQDINSINKCSMEQEDCIGEVVDIHRTGAKCLAGEDKKLPGTLYHVLGTVRIKPGRGDPTLSVSCSDKMARWLACGLQGALMSLLVSRPVLLESVVIGGGGPYSRSVLQRALISRSGTNHRPHFLQSVSVFPHSRYTASETARPCPSAILWTRVSHKALEVCVGGQRQGTTKKCSDNGRLMVCKLEMLRAFLSLSGDKYRGMKYREIKASADWYNNVWAQTKKVLGVWTTKPQHLEDFVLT